jgi:hypothetical protein
MPGGVFTPGVEVSRPARGIRQAGDADSVTGTVKTLGAQPILIADYG